MGQSPIKSMDKSRILLSRNAPVGFVVGVAGFLGSHLADHLLNKGIQVIGVDNLERGSRRNIDEAVKQKNFHFLNESISKATGLAGLELPRLDYAFFVADSVDNRKLLTQGLHNFLSFVLRHSSHLEDQKIADRPRVVFVSSIDLYDRDSDSLELKNAESYFAQFSKDYQLNARVVRLAPLFGPRMHFRQSDPLIRLVQAALLGEVQKETTSLDFLTRAIYVEDAVELLLKSVLSGATAQKIFDGARGVPIKVSEIKQILLDPLWHDARNFAPTELPPWPTPNLLRTEKELVWRDKTPIVQALKETTAYFKDHDIEIPTLTSSPAVSAQLNNPWAEKTLRSVFAEVESINQEQEGDDRNKERIHDKKDKKSQHSKAWTKQGTCILIIGILIIATGLLWPIVSAIWNILTIQQSLKESNVYLQQGEFDKASKSVKRVQKSLGALGSMGEGLEVFKNLPSIAQSTSNYEQLFNMIGEGVDGVEHAIKGSQALYRASKIISGEDKSDPTQIYQTAQLELSSGFDKLVQVQLKLSDPGLTQNLPKPVKSRVGELQVRLSDYAQLIDKAQAAARILPELTGVAGKRAYLVLIQNNFTLRSSGGVIESFAQFNFENGRLTRIKVDDTSSLDQKLAQQISPPTELQSDLGVNQWLLKDASSDPDFPSTSQIAEFFYRKEAPEEHIDGVFALDLGATSQLLKASNGLELPDFSLHLDQQNLAKEVISRATQTPTSPSFLTTLHSGLFNKIFFLSKQNWPAIVEAIGTALDEKHLMLYISDPRTLSFAASENWIGLIPRPGNDSTGTLTDFLYVNEANMSDNQANYYLERAKQLETTIGDGGEISHKLMIHYKNTSPNNNFPAGSYKDRIRVYLPVGSKLSKATFKEQDVTPDFTTYSDYGRAVYSALLELFPGETATLTLEYSLPQPLSFKDNTADYQLNVLKQPGTAEDSFDWKLTTPPTMKLNSAQPKDQTLQISTDLSRDRSFKAQLSK